MVKKKRKSKRTSLKDKYKAERRVVQHHRKARKQSKKDAKLGIIHHKKKKDPGIPNSWPFKKELLNEIARARDLAEQRKLQSKTNKSEKKRENLEELMARAQASKTSFEASNDTNNLQQSQQEESFIKTPKQALGKQSRRAHLQTLKTVLESSDILLQVLDARDPIGTRIHPSIEADILSKWDKKMVLVLNKIDLIPKPVVSQWLTYLRRSRPTLALKCGTNNRSKGSNIGRSVSLQSSGGVGCEQLMQLIKNYARSSCGGGGNTTTKTKTCVSVGIIGYPNVGKSSIINTLKRSRCVGVSPRPGFTTNLCEVVLDKTVRLIDSPGVVFDDSEDTHASSPLLRNCVDETSVEDPVPAVEALINRCDVQSLITTYAIPAFPKGDVNVFLAMVAKRTGRVGKGGIPDKQTAARIVLRDWNGGKIPYYTTPPTLDAVSSSSNSGNNPSSSSSSTLSSPSDVKILSGFDKEFDVNEMDEAVLNDLDDSDAMDFVQIKAAPTTQQPKNSLGEKNDLVRFLNGNVDPDENEDEDMADEENDIDEDDDMEEKEEEEIMEKNGKQTFTNSAVADAEDYDFSDL